MEREKKKKSKEKEISIITRKNKRTGKYYEKEVEGGGSRSINLRKNYTDNWDKDLYSPPSPEPKPIKTLQEYLDNKYPTKKDKEAVEDIVMKEINEERKTRGIDELLEGGELDLREYPNLEWIMINDDELKTLLVDIEFKDMNKLRWVGLIGHRFSFKQTRLLWDKQFLEYSQYRTHQTLSPLVKVDDLTQLAYQLNEHNWQDPNFIKQFGISEKNIESLKDEDDKVYTILDNLNNQVIARYIIVSNRLTHGIDKEVEDEIIRLGLGYMNCSELKEYLKETDEEKVKKLVDKVLAGDKELSSRLQNLPWENPSKELESKVEYPAPGSYPK